MRRLVLMAAVLACVMLWLPTTARAAADDIPGTPLQFGQTVFGTLDSTTKKNDVYALQLSYGEQVQFTVHNEPGHTGNTMYLYSPTTKSAVNYPSSLMQASTYNGQQTGQILYTPAVDGTYFVQIRAGGHNDTFDFTVAGSAEKPAYPSSIFIRASKTSVKRGGKVTVSGSLADQDLKPLKGKSVSLQRSYDGKKWARIQTLNAQTGRYSEAVTISGTTWFRTSFTGDSDNAACTSRRLLVKAK